MEQQFIETAINIIQPVMESAMVMAAEYSKACGRTFVTSMDLKYSMRYCAMNLVGKHMGTHFPEIYNSDESDDESDIEVVEEEEADFTRYEGSEEIFLKVNESFDEWENWEPQSPAEKMLKDAIDKQQ